VGTQFSFAAVPPALNLATVGSTKKPAVAVHVLGNRSRLCDTIVHSFATEVTKSGLLYDNLAVNFTTKQARILLHMEKVSAAQSKLRVTAGRRVAGLRKVSE